MTAGAGRTLAAVSLLVSMALAGCWGGGAEVRNSNQATTLGQELIDLQRARDQGLLDEREYEKQRRRILRRRD
jgi:cytochrome c-type biogenesis protein CcmH/NrfG